MRSLTSQVARIMLVVVVGLMVVVALASGVLVSAAGVAGSTTTALLPAGGGWAAYSFTFPGPGSHVGITLSYSPVDGFTEVHGAVTFDVYSPLDPYLKGKPVGSGTKTAPGMLYYQLDSQPISLKDQVRIRRGEMTAPLPAGDYIVIIHNWDPQGRSLAFQLATTNVAEGGSGPAVKLVSASAGAEVTPAEPEATAQARGSPAPATTTPAAPSTVTTVVPAGGGWVAYNFPYLVTGKQVGVTLTYSPVDGFTESKGAITFDAYSPLDPYLKGKPIGTGTKIEPGEIYWQLGTLALAVPETPENELTPMPRNMTRDPTVSPVGNYLVIVHNWDPLGRPVTITLTTTDAQSGGPGPGLTLVSSGQ
jgi:hypothetical protein